MQKREFPAVLRLIGIPIVALAWIWVALVVWDQTVVAWTNGPAYLRYPSAVWAYIPLFLGMGLGLLWSVAVIIAAVLTRSSGGPAVAAQLAAFVLAGYVQALPSGFWQRLFIEKYAPQQAVEVLAYAVDEGDIRTAEAFLDAGVDVNARSRNGSYALHVAVAQRDLQMIEFLIKRGADVNAANLDGDSPLAVASHVSRDREVHALLSRHGAVVIRLPEGQRRRIKQERVRQELEEMHLKVSEAK